MTEPPASYSARRQLIAEKLDPYFGVSSMVPTNTSSAFEPGMFEHSLACSWADPETLSSRTLSVFIDPVSDGASKAADVRDMMQEEAVITPGEEPQDAEAYEVPGQNPGEYVFVLNYLGRLTAIAGNCVVQVMPWPVTAPLGDLAHVALDIARTVGCSAYVDDFEPPAIDHEKASGTWSTADGWVYDPRTPPSR